MRPAAQVSAHAPCEQTSPALHFVPHAPQFDGSTFVSTHVAPHFVVPPTHSSAHSPFAQTCPAEHFVPHVPQLFGSDFVSAQLVPHCVVPAPHSMLQCPFEHTSPAPHAAPHAPQFDRSLDVSTQPDAQAVCPVGQVGPASTVTSAVASADASPGVFAPGSLPPQPAAVSTPSAHAATTNAARRRALIHPCPDRSRMSSSVCTRPCSDARRTKGPSSTLSKIGWHKQVAIRLSLPVAELQSRVFR
jgi:hypothetical protein